MMPDCIDLIVMVLATWRLSHLLVNEDGPWDIFLRLRKLVGIKYDEDGDIESRPEKKMAKLFDCLPCMSVWLAGLVYLIWYFEPIPIWIFAASGGAMLIERLRE